MKHFVIEFTLATNAAGDTTKYYYCSGTGFATKSTDTPANTWVEPRVIDPGTIRRELFSGNRTFGAIRPSFGGISLANTDGALDAWLGYGISGHPIVIYWGDEGSAYPGGYTQVTQIYGKSLVANFESVRVNIEDRLKLLDKPVLKNTFLGTGGAEGSEAGLYKQRGFGEPVLLPPVILDTTKLIYFIHDDSVKTSLRASQTTYEGGVAITRGTDYTSISQMETSAPTAGQCRYLFDSKGVFVRLGSTPVYELRCNTNPSKDATTNHSTGTLAIEAGVTGASGGQALTNHFINDSSVTYLDMFNDQAQIQLFSYGFDLSDNFFTTVFAVPGTSTYTFNQHNSWAITRNPPEGMAAPMYKISANIGKTYPANFASSATDVLKDNLTRSPYHLQVDNEDSSILDKHPNAPSVQLNVNCKYINSVSGGWSTIYNNFDTLFGTERDFITLKAPFNSDTLALDLHDTVTLQIPRFGMSSGKKFRIISQELHLRKPEITFGLWG